MSFPKYPAYKEASATELAPIPLHWDLKRLKRLVTRSNAGEVIDKSHWGESAHRELLYTCALEPLASDFPDFPLEKRTTEQDLLLTRNGTPYVHKPLANSIYSNVVQRVTLNGNVVRDFMAVAAQHAARSLKGYGVSIESLNYEMWKELPICVPSLEEQKSITTFLDRETAKIDALVAEQEQLITLLKEKRQAVISHAVTKGLDPSVPMKDSGVGSLGKIPSHWEVVPMKHIGSICYGIGEPPAYQLEGVPLIRATNVDQGTLMSEGMVFVDPADIPSKRIVWLLAGDIIVVRSGAYTGDSAIIPSGYGDCIAGFDMVLRCHSAHPNFVQFALLSDQLKRGQIDLMRMRAAQPHLNAEELGGVLLALPPTTDEQLEIAALLAKELRDVDQLVKAAVLSIELLRERRSALISAAVTGQIDVRGLAPALGQAA